MRDLAKLSAVEAAKAIRDGATTSFALVEACLARIAGRDAVVEAWAHLDPGYAVAQARAADATLASGKALGALHGVPVAVKDIIDTADYPTEHGTPIFKGRRPTADASLVTQLRAAGAIILGKTVTTELAFFGPGKSRNPHNPEHTPGGSSSGSAAAVADFQVPLALGTQTAGSILRPASYCGVIGFKPSFGTVSREGVLEQSPPLDTIGGYARSIDDIALLIDAMSSAHLSPVAMPLKPPRLAFVKTPAWEQGEDVMKRAFADLVRFLGPQTVDEISLPPSFDGTGGIQRAVQFRDIARSYGPLLDAHPGRISAKLADVITEGRTVSDTEYEAACARRASLNADIAPIFAAFDAILTPASTGPAPSGLGSTGSPAFNFLWTYLGLPAISLPILEAHGLPLGVQLAGAMGQDATLLATAKWLMSWSQA